MKFANTLALGAALILAGAASAADRGPQDAKRARRCRGSTSPR